MPENYFMHVKRPKIGKHLIEQAAIEGYRSGKLSRGQVAKMLHLDWEDTEAFLAKHQCNRHYALEDLEQDRKSIGSIFGPTEKAQVLKFISENQKLAGFSGHISKEVAEFEPDMREIARNAKRFGAQVPTWRRSKVKAQTIRRNGKLAKALPRGISTREKMATEEGGSMSAEEVARLLGMAKQSAINRYRQGRLLGWRSGKQGAVRFPVWQFHNGGMLPGIEQVLAKLSASNILDDWGKVGFFLQQHRLSESRRPLDLLRENKLEQVLRIVEAYVA
jgi:predicted HTH domain antitoxin